MMSQSEIAFSTSKTGSQVASLFGKQLSSFINPEQEAANWCQHYKEVFKRKKSVVVLGLACGHHVKALYENYLGPIYVVETISALREAWTSQALQYPRVHVLSLSEFEMEIAKGELLLPIGVLTYAPAIAHDANTYRSLFNLFSGRDAESLENQFKLRGQDHFFLPKELNFQDPKESFKKLALAEGINFRWKTLFQLLGEIVK